VQKLNSFTRSALLASLCLTLVLQGCALFVSHYDAGAYQNFTSLKAFHLKVIDDNTAASGKTFDEAKARTTCDAGDLKFREALEYAGGKQDPTRVRAITYLHNTFQRDCELLTVSPKKPFSAAYSREQTLELKTNYDLAVAGESARVGAPSK